MEKEMVRVSFDVEKEVVVEFKKVVVQKYGQLWGFLQKEFQKALKNRLEELKEELLKENSQN